MWVTERREIITINSAFHLIGGNIGGGRGGGMKTSHFETDHLLPLLDGNPAQADSTKIMLITVFPVHSGKGGH